MKTDWVYIFKAVFATLLAMGIAMRLEIDQPRIAMLTVMVVIQPQSGMVVEKSIYRMLGTLAGCIASLVLFGLFAQQRGVLLVALSLWVGICTAGAARYRNHAPYGFVLAGYTACIIMMPLVEHPLRVFQVAIDRMAVVGIGVFCAALVSSIVLPQTSAKLLVRAMDERFGEFIRFVSDALRQKLDYHALRARHLHFASSVVGFESYRSGATFEDPHILADSRQLRRLNADFINASTRFHALTSLINRMRGEHEYAAYAALQSVFADIGSILAPEGKALESQAETLQAAAHIKQMKDGLLLRSVRLRAALEEAESETGLRDYDTAVELLFRFLGDLHDYMRAHASRDLPRDRPTKNGNSYRYIPKTDGAASLMSGIRAGLVMLLLGVFWMVSQWPSGGAACVFGSAAVCLCAIAPKPQRAAKHGMFAGALVVIGGFICDFLIMPHIDGFWLLCLALAPFLMIGPWLQLQPEWIGAGILYGLFFSFVAGPSNLMHYDPVQFLNTMVALLVGFAMAALSYLVLVPPDSVWLMRRRMRNLRRLTVQACLSTREGAARYFDSATRDMVHYMAIGQWSAADRKAELLDWTFPVMEVGHAVLELREEMRSAEFPHSLKRSYNALLRRTARLFELPEITHVNSALNALDRALKATSAVAEVSALPTRHTLRHAQSYLHFIRTALVDMQPLLAPPRGAYAT